MSKFEFKYEQKPLPGKVGTIAYSLVALGALLVILAFVFDPTRATFNSIISFMFLLGIGIGSLFLVALEYIGGAVWSVPFRRISEFLVPVAFVSAILAIPVLFNLHDAFHWTHQEALDHDPILAGKVPYLNTTFFVIRFAAVLVLMMIFYLAIVGNSRKQDLSADQALTRKNIKLSAIFMPVLGISITAMAVDWLMSLEPHWFSTIFGVYYFIGSLLSALAALTYISVRLYEKGMMPKQINKDHFYNMGALMFAFINFWAYIAFSQFLLIWYANLPEETFWYMARFEGNWQYISWGIIFVHFLIPYAAMVAQPSKSNFKILKSMSIWILFARFYDLYWLVMPTYSKEAPVIGWIEIAFPILAIGLVILVFKIFSKNKNFIPVGDPKLQRGLEFHL